jgi:hypothetical protein
MFMGEVEVVESDVIGVVESVVGVESKVINQPLPISSQNKKEYIYLL